MTVTVPLSVAVVPAQPLKSGVLSGPGDSGSTSASGARRVACGDGVEVRFELAGAERALVGRDLRRRPGRSRTRLPVPLSSSRPST